MYTSTTLIQQRTGQTLTSDQESLLNAVIIPAIQQWINNYLGTSYADTETPDTNVIKSGDGTRVLLVPELKDITAIAPVDADGVVGTPLDDGTWYVEGTGIYLRTGRFTEGWGNYQITGTQPATPGNVSLAATILASNILNSGANTAAGDITSERIGDYAVTYSKAGSDNSGSFSNVEVLNLLAPYRPLRIA